MAYRSRLMAAAAAMTMMATTGGTARAEASYLFWGTPNFAGTPSRGDEPGIGLPMPGATPAELSAHLIWNLRAGLNVAALQCQFAPGLATVRNYNDMLRQHSAELAQAYQTITGYFRRTAPGGRWQVALDQYTTRTYNGFSTLHAQLGFCHTAGAIGAEALTRRRGELHLTAAARMREFRNSLVPFVDAVFPRSVPWLGGRPLPSMSACYDRRGRTIACS